MSEDSLPHDELGLPTAKVNWGSVFPPPTYEERKAKREAPSKSAKKSKPKIEKGPWESDLAPVDNSATFGEDSSLNSDLFPEDSQSLKAAFLEDGFNPDVPVESVDVDEVSSDTLDYAELHSNQESSALDNSLADGNIWQEEVATMELPHTMPSLSSFAHDTNTSDVVEVSSQGGSENQELNDLFADSEDDEASAPSVEVTSQQVEAGSALLSSLDIDNPQWPLPSDASATDTELEDSQEEVSGVGTTNAAEFTAQSLSDDAALFNDGADDVENLAPQSEALEVEDDSLADLFGDFEEEPLNLEGAEIVEAGPVSAPKPQGPQNTDSLNSFMGGHLSAKEIEQLRVLNSNISGDIRFREADRLYPVVDAILGLIQSDATLQSMAKRLELSQDEGRFRSQIHQLQSQVSPMLNQIQLPLIDPKHMGTVYEMVFDELVGLGPAGPFFRDPEVTEIIIFAYDSIVVERGGALVPTIAKFKSLEEAQRIARNLSALVSDRALNMAKPIVTAELPDSRVQFAYGSVVSTGISIVLRKFKKLLGMDDLIHTYNALTPEMAQFLADAVHARATMLISGGTGTGKTTFINALSKYIPNGEHVITIENAYELQLTNRLVTRLRTKEAASADDQNHVTQEDLMVASLRMRPDRIILGEIREPAEAVVMLTAANTGHDGTMTTLHANSPSKAIRRMTNLVRTQSSGMPDDVAQADVASAINLVVQVTRRAGRRFVSSIAVIDESCIQPDGQLVAHEIFKGHLSEDGTPVFQKVSGLPKESELYIKMADADIDVTRWM